MATQVKVNGKIILADSKFEAARQAIFTVMSTKNPLTDGIESSLSSLPNGAAAFYEALNAAGTSEDVFTVEEKPQGKDTWEFAAECSRKILSNRLFLALHKQDYEVKLPVKTGKEKSEKVTQAAVTADLLA